ncbi:MAG TPA: prolyl oligopeptidase family serine peptidase [Bryobacteraceae bacterium]
MKTRLVSSILCGLAASVCATAVGPQDLWDWVVPGTPRIDPGGTNIVFIERRYDRTADAEYTNLRFIPAAGGRAENLTDGPWRDVAPQWSRGGESLAWISGRGGRRRFHVLRLSTKKEIMLADPAEEPLEYSWSPDGNSLAFTAKIIGISRDNSWDPPTIFARLRRPASPIAVFVAPVAGGAARRVSTGDSDYATPAWMPDGQSILASDGQIREFRLDGAPPRQLTHEGINTGPVPSPDGSRIAWLSATAKPQSYAPRRLYVMNRDGSRVKPLTGALDRDVMAPQWSSDSRTLYFLADDAGATYVYAARNDGSARRVTAGGERLRGFSLADNGRAAVVRSTASEAAAIITLTVDRPSAPVKLAGWNEEWRSQAGTVEELHYESAGNSIQAWLVKPPDFDPAKKYPLLVDAADAPRRMYGYEFQLRAQILAAGGWVVLCANPRGTPGYGEAFGNLIRTRYPGDDFDDLMRGVDAAIAKGYIDPKRLAFSGGLLAAWALGHTDRFQKVIARSPIVDWAVDVALAGDGARRAANWMGAMPWDDPDQYVKRSPLFYAQNFKTPTLLLADPSDAESRQLYWALRQRNVRTEWVETSAAPKPSERVLELEAVRAWLEFR